MLVIASSVLFSSGDCAPVLQSCLVSVQSWMSINKLKLTPYKTEFLLIGNEQQWSKYHSMFSIELFGVKTYPAKSALNLGVIFDKNFNFQSHICAICRLVFTTSRICGIFAVTLIYMVQNWLQMHWCLAISVTVSHLCLVSQILT